MKEKEPFTRKELIKQCISWKMRNPSYLKLVINRREVLTPQEVGMRLNPEPYNLPRVFESRDQS